MGPRRSLQSKLLIQEFLPRTPASCERGCGGLAQAWHRPESLPVSNQGLCMTLRFQLASFHREGRGMFVFHPLTQTHNLDCKETQPVHPKGNQSWMCIGRTDAEAETPILWPHDAKSWLIWKDPDAGKDWRWEEKGMTEDEMVGRHHWLNGHEFAHAPGVGDGQGDLACSGSQGPKESDATERLNWTELSWRGV